MHHEEGDIPRASVQSDIIIKASSAKGQGTFFCESALPYWDSSLYSSAQKSPLSPLASCTALSSQLLALSTCTHEYGLEELQQHHWKLRSLCSTLEAWQAAATVWHFTLRIAGQTWASFLMAATPGPPCGHSRTRAVPQPQQRGGRQGTPSARPVTWPCARAAAPWPGSPPAECRSWGSQPAPWRHINTVSTWMTLQAAAR